MVRGILQVSMSSHPFERIFMNALKKSTLDENLVLCEALKIRKKGYAHAEILAVLSKLQKSLIDNIESQIVEQAIEEFEID